MASVKLENIQKAFGNVIAVDQLDLEIEAGEFFTLLGPSGCGKTTTLRVIAGFYYPTKGVVRFGDKDMTRVPPEKRNTGMVFQNYALFPHMTVFENVAFGLKVRKKSLKEIKRKVSDVLEKVRLEKYMDRQVSQLSGGQQQRVALARALVIEPEILLLDEPLSNLDARLRDEMRAEIQRLQQEYKITTIYVTHDQVEALSMSDRIAVFHFGVCQQVGTPLDIYNEPKNDFVASFIGEINLLPIKIEKINDDEMMIKMMQSEQQLVVANTSFNYQDRSKRENLLLAIRPEEINLSEQPLHGENVLQGKIDHVEFQGSIIHFTVDYNGLKLQSSLLNRRDLITLTMGNKVWMELPKDRIRIIPKVNGDHI